MIHLYYGDGKGKTSAATGLAIRMAGHGKKVYIAQFLKGGISGEIEFMKGVSSILIGRLEKEYNFYPKLSLEERGEITKQHNEILKEVQKLTLERKVDLVVLDEITYPYNWGLLDKELVKRIFLDLPEEVEVVCTGSNPDKLFFDNADYVTEMRKERHPFDKGVDGREGVEW